MPNDYMPGITPFPNPTAANTICSPNVELMFAHRLRRWPHINSTLGHRLISAGTTITREGTLQDVL